MVDQIDIDRFRNQALSFNAHFNFYRMIDELEKPSTRYNCSLFSIIDEIVLNRNQSPFYKVLPAGTILYRARVINPDCLTRANGIDIIGEKTDWHIQGFDEANSVECPLGIGSIGRNNIKGASYLYVAEDEATACAEVKSNLLDILSLAEFELKKPLEYIDFSKDVSLENSLSSKYAMNMAEFMTRVMSKFTTPVSNEKEYLASQVISDYIRKTGVDALAYMSHFTQKSNFTVFHSHKSNIVFKSSRIILHYGCDDVFLDYNHRRELHAKSPMPETNDNYYQQTYLAMKQLLKNKEKNDGKQS